MEPWHRKSIRSGAVRFREWVPCARPEIQGLLSLGLNSTRSEDSSVHGSRALSSVPLPAHRSYVPVPKATPALTTARLPSSCRQEVKNCCKVLGLATEAQPWFVSSSVIAIFTQLLSTPALANLRFQAHGPLAGSVGKSVLTVPQSLPDSCRNPLLREQSSFLPSLTGSLLPWNPPPLLASPPHT